jgi:hypothetical protein
MTTCATSSARKVIDAEEELRQGFESWLPRICRHPLLHARFINTLSMLEHIGSVKIAATQSGAAITGEILQHLAEETRHATHLKRMIDRLGVMPRSDYHDRFLLAGATARGYFARLDASTRRFVVENFPAEIHRAATYQLVTWLVECRAMWLYPAYQSILQRERTGLSVRSIIGEETRHLEDIVEGMRRLGIADHPELPELQRIEHGHFARLVSGMRREAERSDHEE